MDDVSALGYLDVSRPAAMPVGCPTGRMTGYPPSMGCCSYRRTYCGRLAPGAPATSKVTSAEPIHRSSLPRSLYLQPFNESAAQTTVWMG